MVTRIRGGGCTDPRGRQGRQARGCSRARLTESRPQGRELRASLPGDISPAGLGRELFVEQDAPGINAGIPVSWGVPGRDDERRRHGQRLPMGPGPMRP